MQIDFFFCVNFFDLANNKNMSKKVLILFVSICVISALLFVMFNFFIPKKDYDDLVQKYSAEYGLEKELVLSVIKAESDFDERAISKSGALGLMQIIPSTAKWIASEFDENFESEKMFDAETNIKYGCFYLRYLFDKFNSLDVVVCAYNAGEGVVRNWLDENGNLVEEKISYAETRVYLNHVREFYQQYKKS